MNFEERIFQRLHKGTGVRAEIKVLPRPGVSNFYLRKEDRYNYIRHRLAAMKPHFLELLGIDRFEAVNHVSSASFYTYGVIVSPNGCKLDAAGIFISSNTDDSNDVVVRLHVGHLQRYSVFPGQVVAVQGKNMNGDGIVVEILHCMPILDINTASPHGVYPAVLAASGPYGSDSGFDVLDGVLASSADVLILLGPFVNRAEGDCSASMEEFASRIRGWLDRNSESKAVLVPSTGDLGCLNVFPQQALDVQQDRVFCVGNPGEFLLNGRLFAVCSLDTPLELSSEECFHDSGVEDKADPCGEILFQSDRMSRISHHLVFQRTYLPVFPSVNVVSLSVPSGLSMDTAPDVYIVSSKLRYFAREAGPTLVVNVGSQSKIANKVLGQISLGGLPSVEFRGVG